MAKDYKIEVDEGIYEFSDCQPVIQDGSFSHEFGVEQRDGVESVNIGEVWFAPYNNADPSSGQLGDSERIPEKMVGEEAMEILKTEVEQDYAGGVFDE